MTLEEINKQWAIDADISDDVFEESRKIPKLHQKYYSIYASEALKYRAEKVKLESLVKTKTEYFRGQLDPAEVRQLGWPLLNVKILKEDVALHVETDKDVVAQSLKVGMFNEKIKYLEDIIKQIHSRNFILKNMADWKKFCSGG